MDILKRFLDEEGKIKQLPVKMETKLIVLGYLAEKFETNRDYKEKEVNAIIDCWHTFGDYFVYVESLLIMICSDAQTMEQDTGRK